MSNVIKNPCNLYTIGWCLYYLQGTLYPTGSMIGKVVLALLLLYSLAYIFSNRSIFNTRYFKVLTLILVMYAVYTVFYMAFGESFIHSGMEKAKTDTLKTVLISTLPVFCFYGYAVKGHMTEEWINRWIWVLLILAICSFYNEQNNRLQAAILEGSSREEFTNNTAYLFSGLIPMLVIANLKPVYKYAILSVALAFALMAMKRGAILVAAISTVIFLFYDLKSQSRSSKIKVLLYCVALITLLYFSVQGLLENSMYFNHRLEQTLSGDSSGRDSMYSGMIDYFFNQNTFLGILIGHGIDGTGLIFGNGAHNDWIEFAIDMGLLGLLLYFIYWTRLYKSWRHSRAYPGVSTAFLIIVVSEFLKSLFSFSINDLPIQLIPALGYCLAYVQTGILQHTSN